MKNIKIVLLLLILMMPLSLFAKGYDWGSIVNWSVSSWTKNCPSWKVLYWRYDYSGQPRSWSAVCYRPDNTAPSISIDTHWYNLNTWTNTDKVTVSVSISDSQSWLWSMWYTINWARTNTSSSYSIDFTKEWTYLVRLYAYDKATLSSYNWSSVTGNLWYKSIVIKIDRSKPGFSISPIVKNFTETIKWWFGVKPKIGFELSDLYEGANIKIKNYACTFLPEHAKYSYPVENISLFWTGVTWSCNASSWLDCTVDSNYNPNMNDCNWTCDDWYVSDWDSCVIEHITLSCNSGSLQIPDSIYVYNEREIVINDWDSWDNIFWSEPSWVPRTWIYQATYDLSEQDYLPWLNSCQYSCSDWLHKEISYWWKCINDVTIVCCNKWALSYIADTWAAIDCTLDENKDDPRCAFNDLCNWYIKDVLWDWNISEDKWEFDDSMGNLFDSSQAACGYEVLPDSDWFVCNNYYSLTWSEVDSTRECILTDTWEWSNDKRNDDEWNNKYDCTNKSKHSKYTSNWYDNNCSYACDDWYFKDDSSWDSPTWKCVKDIDWECWSANWLNADEQPEDDDRLCAAWDFDEKRDKDGKFKWKCEWTTWHSKDVNCESIEKTISCWSSDWETLESKPTTNLCKYERSINWTDENADDGTWNWTCISENWNNDKNCKAYKQTYCEADGENECTVQ